VRHARPRQVRRESYLGPSFAVLLFARVEALGVAWLRIASAALIFALWRRPWHTFRALDRGGRVLIVSLGAVFGVMNACFYLAIDRLPLATVEFGGPVLLALVGARVWRNVAAARRPAATGVDGLAAAMVLGFVFVFPIGFAQAAPAFVDPAALAAGIGVGVSSSVIPYVFDQLAMARLPRATRYIAKHGEERLRSVVFASAVPPYLMKTDDNPDGPLDESAAEEMASSSRTTATASSTRSRGISSWRTAS